MSKKVLFIGIFMASYMFAIQPQLSKQKKATGIDLPSSEWRLPDALKEDGYIDEAKMPKGSKYAEMVILGNKIVNETSRYVGPYDVSENNNFSEEQHRYGPYEQMIKIK